MRREGGMCADFGWVRKEAYAGAVGLQEERLVFHFLGLWLCCLTWGAPPAPDQSAHPLRRPSLICALHLRKKPFGRPI